jgi:hypothetical protein
MPLELLICDATISSISLGSPIMILEASFDYNNMFMVQATELM